MPRFPSLLAFLTAAAFGAPPVITTEPIPPPAAAEGASGSSLAVSPEGVPWLAWLETKGKLTALRCATYDPDLRRWSAARTIAEGPDWFVNWADFPDLTLGPGGRATAVWFVNNPAPPAPPAGGHDHHGPGYRAMVATTDDSGRTWSPPALLTTESSSVEFVSLATLADGRVLAAWLDGRAKSRGGRAQQLFARVLGEAAPDALVDDSVCDCCQTTLTAFPDGSALSAYRGRTAGEVRDIRLARFRGRTWDAPRALHADNWKINACPVNGPQLASDGGRVAVAWFTAADDDPRVLASFSPDAGGRFLSPLRVSDGRPAGRVDTLLLHNTTLLVTWVDAAGALWLRRISPDFAPAEPLRLTRPEDGRVKGFPRLALVRDYVGGDKPAHVLVSYTADAAPALRTLLLAVPEADLLRAEQNCDCAPRIDDLRGFPIRGIVVEARPAEAVLRVRVFEVPGVIPEGIHDFHASAAVLANAGAAGGHFLGRFEKGARGWTLVSVRPIVGSGR